MRVQVMSDLHFEFHRDLGRAFVDSLDSSGVDVLLLAGDIGCAGADSLLYGVGLLTEKYPQVVMVAGNHEYYGSSPVVVARRRDLMQSKLPNFHWLDNNAVVIEKQRFIGATLWYPQPQDLRMRYRMSDFTAIADFEPWVYEKHAATRDYLNREVRPDDVVLTHMLPTPAVITPRWQFSPLNCFFAVHDLTCVATPKLWHYGHSHDAQQKKYGDCRLVCNPLGYPNETRAFNSKLVFEL